MKKTIATILAFILLLTFVPVMAEEVQPEAATAEPVVTGPNYDELVVGNATSMTGSFFTSLWGDNTADFDVRTLIHAYSTVRWNGDIGSYGIDDSVVSGFVVTDDLDGNRTYTVAIYDDLVYSDGTPITAADYVFSVLFSVAPQVKEIGGSSDRGDVIFGVDEFRGGESTVLTGLRLLDTYQFSITVKAEYLPFFYELSTLAFTPYPISVIAPGCEVKDDGEGAYIAGEFTADLLRETVLNEETGYMTHPTVCSGPYILTSYDAETKTATFEINPKFKGTHTGALPTIPKLIYTYVPTAEATAKIEAGEIGLMNKCVKVDAIDKLMQLTQSGVTAVSNYARSGLAFVNFNCERPTVNSDKVRKAIAHCFDRDAFVEATVGTYGTRVDGYYGVGQWMYRMVNGSALLLEPEDPTEEELKKYEEDLARIEAMSMDNVQAYPLDVEAAIALLEEDGWMLNADGIREKEIDGEAVALNLVMLYPEDNAVGDVMQTTFLPYLKEAGIELTLVATPFDQLLDAYYRTQPRDCDMIYLATNFSDVFEPTGVFDPNDADIGVANRTGIKDETLFKLSRDMRGTEPGDAVGYCEKWVKLQERWSEVLPAIPLYSNVYFDFYTPTLQNYKVGSAVTWSAAIVEAYLGDVVIPETTEDAAPVDDVEEF